MGVLVRSITGISLRPGKEELVKSRLSKRLRALKIDSFDAYLDYVEADCTGDELCRMIDELTTNKTSFFRESEHFDYVSNIILPKIAGREVRFWSAGCSSGEEPYTMAVVLREHIKDFRNRDVRILATDISPSMLKRAQSARYGEEVVSSVPPVLLTKYFACVKGERPREYAVTDEIKSMVKFARLNLMGPWCMKGQFDVIFCRNVMIYFDEATRLNLVCRFCQKLGPGGYLFLGLSESLLGGCEGYKYIQPGVYRKEGM